MRVIDLQIDEIFAAGGDRYFRITIQVGALKIQGRLTDRSFIYLMQGKPATMRDAEVSGQVLPLDAKWPVTVDADALNLRKVDWL